MIYRFLIAAIALIGTFILIYKILTSNNKNENETPVGKPRSWLDNFNKPIFKIPIGSLIILGTLVWSFNLVKMVPMIEKIGLIGLNFIIIYTVIVYLFKNKQKSN